MYPRIDIQQRGMHTNLHSDWHILRHTAVFVSHMQRRHLQHHHRGLGLYVMPTRFLQHWHRDNHQCCLHWMLRRYLLQWTGIDYSHGLHVVLCWNVLHNSDWSVFVHVLRVGDLLHVDRSGRFQCVRFVLLWDILHWSRHEFQSLRAVLRVHSGKIRTDHM